MKMKIGARAFSGAQANRLTIRGGEVVKLPLQREIRKCVS